MALFPAFSGDVDTSNHTILNDNSDPIKESWLKNPSYSCIETSSEKSLDDCVIEAEISPDEEISVILHKRCRSKSPHRYNKNKKKKTSKSGKSLKDRGKRREESDFERPIPDDPTVKFYEDRTKQAGNLIVPTLRRPAVPLYSRQFWMPIGTKYNSSYHSWKMSGKQGRYFLSSLTDGRVKMREGFDNETDEETAEQSEKSGEAIKGIWRTSRLEKEVQHATEFFNRRLAEHPHDVRTWLEFLRFQERASELQFRGGRSKRALAQRKLDILEKALQENPRSWLLLREKIHLEQFLYPPDELELKLGKEAEGANSLGPWMAYLEVLRSRATTTEVCINYGKSMEVARREGRASQRRTGRASVSCDERIVDLLFSCGLYMRQAGLWERLWTLIRMYLELNLKPAENVERSSPEIHFDIGAQPNDNEVEELEAEVFKSGLPLSEIWLRVEGLRQSVRWLPFSPSDKDEPEGDLQRLVFPEDVSELVHPLSTVGKKASSGIISRLASVALLLLKVPILPCRDTALRRHGFPSWSCDTPEVPLTAIYSGGPWDWGKGALPFDLLGEMIAGGGGPQYLLPRPGRDLYLQSIQRLFLILTEVAGSADDQQYFGVWWLRFERWLIMLEEYKSSSDANFSLPQKWKKHLKATLKEFLSREKNRSSLALYREYALIDAALGKKEPAIRTLCTAATLGGHPVVGERDRAELCSVYRTLAELILKQEFDKFFHENENIQSTFPRSKTVPQCDEKKIPEQRTFPRESKENDCSHSGNSSQVVGLNANCDVLGADGKIKFVWRKKSKVTRCGYSDRGTNNVAVVNLKGSGESDGKQEVGDPCTSSVCSDLGIRDPESVLASKSGKNQDTFSYTLVNQTMPSHNLLISVDKDGESANWLVEGADTADVISLNVKNVDIDTSVKKKSRWDVRKPSIGTGGRRPRWTAAGVFMGSVFCNEKDDCEDVDGVVSSETKKSDICIKKSRAGRGEREREKLRAERLSSASRTKRKESSSSDLKFHSFSSFEKMATTVLTRLGLGKPLGSLEEAVDQSEITSSLQKYKHVFQEVLKEETGSCRSPESHEDDCKCGWQGGDGGGGVTECFQSYFLVEWLCCWAWLLCLVESAWAAGAAFEEALAKIAKISVEQMEAVEEDEENNDVEMSCERRGGRYNPAVVCARNIREALYEGYISMLLSRRWSQEARSGLNVIMADVIRRALSEFPENVYFAAAVAISENEAGYGGSPWWTVTSYFEGGLGRAGGGGSQTVFGKVFLVLLAEQRRRRLERGRREGHQTAFGLGGPMVDDCGATNRLRCVLRHLVTDSGTKSCPLLWRLYLRFVGAVEGLDDCKGVAYRGLQQCPWVKAFYLDAARLLPEEISQFQDLITERELRLHVSPEELEILRT